MDGTGILFRPFLAALPPGLDPVVVRYPKDVPLGYEELTEIAAAALPEDAPFLLLGESMSGPIALTLAARRPPGLRGIVLVASFVTKPVRYLPRFAGRLSRGALFRFAPLWWRVRTLLGPFASRELLALFLELRVAPDVMARRGREILLVDARAALAASPGPILYLAGADDRIVSRRSLEEIRALRPDVEVETLNASHLVLQVAPREASDAIGRFAARLTSP